jgi:hypothetical protein
LWNDLLHLHENAALKNELEMLNTKRKSCKKKGKLLLAIVLPLNGFSA